MFPHQPTSPFCKLKPDIFLNLFFPAVFADSVTSARTSRGQHGVLVLVSVAVRAARAPAQLVSLFGASDLITRHHPLCFFVAARTVFCVFYLLFNGVFPFQLWLRGVRG